MSMGTVDRTCSNPVWTVTISECTSELGMSTRRPSKVRTAVLVRETAVTVPATSWTAIWSSTRNLSLARITIPADMVPRTVWKAMPAAMVSTPMPPSASTGLTLGKTTVTAAAKADTWTAVRASAPKMALVLGERPLHRRNRPVSQPSARLSPRWGGHRPDG